jgi:hypothetical protein
MGIARVVLPQVEVPCDVAGSAEVKSLMIDPVTKYDISGHAAEEMQRRGLDESIIRQVLSAPEWREAVRPGRDLLQSRVNFEGETFLVRVFVDLDREPAVVVTAYRTSKLQKYWRKP